MGNKSAQKHRQKKRDNGLCYNCSEPAEINKQRCEFHLEQDRTAYRTNREARRNKRRREENRCLGCNCKLHEEADFGYVTCITCREKGRGYATY